MSGQVLDSSRGIGMTGEQGVVESLRDGLAVVGRLPLDFRLGVGVSEPTLGRGTPALFRPVDPSTPLRANGTPTPGDGFRLGEVGWRCCFGSLC